MAARQHDAVIARFFCCFHVWGFAPVTLPNSVLATSSGGVSGKGAYQVRLPLPQEVGDALLDYLRSRPTAQETDYVFVRSIAPFRPFVRGDGVSNVVRRAMKRAGVASPAKGAHVLRHTAATEMLRQGVPLDRIGLVLRHRGIDTTAYYAKADVNLLKQVAQPWPEVLS
jgi:integrase